MKGETLSFQVKFLVWGNMSLKKITSYADLWQIYLSAFCFNKVLTQEFE